MKRALILGLCALTALLSPLAAMAQGTDTGTLQVSLKYGGSAIPGATVSLYQVGQASAVSGGYVFTPVAPYTGVDFYTNSSGLSRKVNDLAVASGARPVLSGVTNNAGTAAFQVGYGVYLIRQTAASGVAAQYESFEPFIAFVPMTNDGGTAWLSTVQAYPKTQPTPTPTPVITPTPTPRPDSAYINLTVTKRWADSGNAANIRPAQITLYLYRKLSTEAEYPNRAFLTVAMTGTGNTWRFTFYQLLRRDENGVVYDYLIREGNVNGYTVSYGNDGFAITNTHATPTPVPGVTPTPTPPPTPVPRITPTVTPQPDIPSGVREIDGEWYYIDDYGVPLGLVPQTGDESDLLLYSLAAAVLLIAAALLALTLRRRRQAR